MQRTLSIAGGEDHQQRRVLALGLKEDKILREGGQSSFGGVGVRLVPARTFGIISARNLEELLDVGDFGRHLEKDSQVGIN